jgi:hypothetical protein
MSLCGAATVPVYLGIGPQEYFAGALQIPSEFHWETTLTPNTLDWLRWAAVSHVLSFEPMQDQNLELAWMGYDPLLHGLLGRAPDQNLWLYEIVGSRPRGCWVSATDERSALETSGTAPMNPVGDLHVAANQVTMSVDCSEPAVVVLSDLMYPGWTVFVDGRRVDPIEYAVFRAVRVNAGAHHILWRYWPASLTAGIVISVFSAVATGLFYGSMLFKKKPRRPLERNGGAGTEKRPNASDGPCQITGAPPAV